MAQRWQLFLNQEQNRQCTYLCYSATCQIRHSSLKLQSHAEVYTKGDSPGLSVTLGTVHSWQGSGTQQVLGCGLSRKGGCLGEVCPLVRRIRTEQHSNSQGFRSQPAVQPSSSHGVLKWLCVLGGGSSSQLWQELSCTWVESLASVCLIAVPEIISNHSYWKTLLIDNCYLWCNCWNLACEFDSSIPEWDICGPLVSDEDFGDNTGPTVSYNILHLPSALIFHMLLLVNLSRNRIWQKYTGFIIIAEFFS